MAIDASLGLPQNAVTIANLGDTATPAPAVIEQEDLSRTTNNPMIYRYTEQWIDENVFDNKGNPPLSAIQNQIGSQATKALYALKRMGFTWNTEYIWSTENIKAIETYPTACKKIIGKKVEQLAKQLHTLIKNENICWWLTPAPQKHPERKNQRGI